MKLNLLKYKKEKKDDDEKTFVTKEQIEEIVKKYPTPFHLYDEKGIRENAKALKEGICMESRIQRIFCCKSDSESVPYGDSEGIWLRK